MFTELYKSAQTHLAKGGWYVEANMNSGKMTWPTFSALQGFWPSIQVLWGDVDRAAFTTDRFYSLWIKYGLLPERYRLDYQTVEHANPGYPLRPEFVESLFYMQEATGGSKWLEMGRDVLSSLEASCWAQCGYATVLDVRNHTQQDLMPSYFLAETAKYLFLLFDHPDLTPLSVPKESSHPAFEPGTEHPMFSHREQELRREMRLLAGAGGEDQMGNGRFVGWANGRMESRDGWVFNTEGHALPLARLQELSRDSRSQAEGSWISKLTVANLSTRFWSALPKFESEKSLGGISEFELRQSCTPAVTYGANKDVCGMTPEYGELDGYHQLVEDVFGGARLAKLAVEKNGNIIRACLLYTSDAADEEDSVDLGGRRIIKKKKREKTGRIGI
eukprot:TRINITY_DN28442_c0_g1_i3.p1 TRINITY_DN28442_c0_g1~~TRINITY_DN28442_c0_g1_i3.p1  ORF type:complete len:389 (+),score=70.56 TRINITY_DN28442_c0_g1_i3:696-1862(+)